MLSIQPRFTTNFKPAFKSNEQDEDYSSINIAEMDQDSYDKMNNELREQKNDFLDLANSDEFKLPKPAKKVLEGGAVVTTGLLGGMATGWGTKKSLQGFSKLTKTAPVQNFVRYMKDARQFIKKSLSAIRKEFIASDFYKKPAEVIKKQYNKFAETQIGKPVTKFYENVKDGISTIYKDVKTGIQSLWRKIKGVDKVTYEKAAVNTVGTSGGIASGVTALKETQEKDQSLNDNNGEE